MTSSDLGVLPKDLCATSPERFASRFQRHLEVTDLPVLFFITVDLHGRKKFIELIFMHAKQEISSNWRKKVVGLPIHRGLQRLLTSSLS